MTLGGPCAADPCVCLTKAAAWWMRALRIEHGLQDARGIALHWSETQRTAGALNFYAVVLLCHASFYWRIRTFGKNASAADLRRLLCSLLIFLYSPLLPETVIMFRLMSSRAPPFSLKQVDHTLFGLSLVAPLFL